MELKIIKKEDEVIVGFNKTFLTINIVDKEKNEEWKTSRINEFLIDLSANVESDDEIIVSFDNEETNEVYKHIVDLFNIFAEEFNRG